MPGGRAETSIERKENRYFMKNILKTLRENFVDACEAYYYTIVK